MFGFSQRRAVRQIEAQVAQIQALDIQLAGKGQQWRDGNVMAFDDYCAKYGLDAAAMKAEARQRLDRLYPGWRRAARKTIA
jgi:hypothetical protein